MISVKNFSGFVSISGDGSWVCEGRQINHSVILILQVFLFFSWIINYSDEFGLMAIASLHNVSVLSSSFLKESQSEAVRRRGDEGGEAPGHRHTCKHSRSLRMSMW